MTEWREHGRRLWQRSELYWAWFQEHGRQWFHIIWQALGQTFGSDTGLIASSIGYYTLLSLFPLILLVVAVASLWVDPNVAESEMMQQLEFIAPGLNELLGKNIESIINARSSVTSFALIMLLWTASNIFTALTRSMDKVWGVVLPWSYSAFRHRGLAMLLVLFTCILILLASLYGGTIVTVVNSFYPAGLRPYQPYTSQLWTTAVSITLFLTLYRFLPHNRLSWRDVLPGALVAGCTWEIVKRTFLMFIDVYLSRTNLVYGSVTTIIVFLTWTYVSCFIFLFGAYVNVAYVQSKKR